MLAADRLHCSPWQLLPPDHALADPQAWIRFAVMVSGVENKAMDHNIKNPRKELVDTVKSKKGHRGEVT